MYNVLFEALRPRENGDSPKIVILHATCTRWIDDEQISTKQCLRSRTWRGMASALGNVCVSNMLGTDLAGYQRTYIVRQSAIVDAVILVLKVRT